jgi:hypothetical protein
MSAAKAGNAMKPGAGLDFDGHELAQRVKPD